MNNKEAKILTDKFFGGETTIEEEKRLYRYFSSPEVDESLFPLKQMFMDFSELQLEDIAEPQSKSHKTKWISLIAAVATIFIIIGVGMISYRSNDECEMMVYGKRLTNKEAVMSEVEHNMNNMSESMPQVDNELKDAFGM